MEKRQNVGTKSAFTPIYVMYKMLCKFLISMLFSFELTHNKAEKPKMRKFSGRGDVTSIN